MIVLQSSEKDDSAYSLFSDEMRDEPLTPRRSGASVRPTPAARSADPTDPRVVSCCTNWRCVQNSTVSRIESQKMALTAFCF